MHDELSTADPFESRIQAGSGSLPSVASQRILLAILLIGFALRVSTVLWGLPIGFGGTFHPDEPKYLGPAIGLTRYYGTTRPFPMYGTSVQYTVGAALLPLKVLPDALHSRTTTWILCRLFVVALGTLCIALTYLLGLRSFDPTTALLGAAFVAVAPYPVLNSAWFTLDVPMSALLCACVLLCLHVAERGGLARHALLGAATGYLVGTKLTAGIFLTVPAVLIACGAWRKVEGRTALRSGLVFGAAAAAVFLVFNPQVALGLDAILSYMLGEKAAHMDRSAEAGTTLLQGLARGYSRSLGTPLAAAAILGAALLRPSRVHHFPAALALFVLVIVHSLVFRHFMVPRYALFVAPVLCLFAGYACTTIAVGRRGGGHVIAGALAVAALVYAAQVSLRGVRARWNDPRIEAARFLVEEYPGPRRIAFGFESEEYPFTHAWRFPTLHGAKHRRVTPFEAPDLLVTSSFVMEPIERALASGHVGPGYVWDDAKNAWWYRYSPPSPRLLALYDGLLTGQGPWKRVRTFAALGPASSEFAPPSISIYAREGSPGP